MKLLRSPLPMLRAKLPRLEANVEAGPTTPRLRGSALQRMRHRVIVRDGYLCQCSWCQAGGHPLRLTLATMELDHITPVHEGGDSFMPNLRALHRECHARITAEQRAAGWGRMAGGASASGGEVLKI